MTESVADPIAELQDRHAWFAPARISVTGPNGWHPSEQVDVTHVDGNATVRVESWPVVGGFALEEIARSHAERFAGATGWTDLGTVAGPVLGVDGLVRSATWRDDDAIVRARFGYALVRGRAHVVSEVVRGADDRLAAQARSIASSAVTSSSVEIDEEHLPLREPGDFSAPARAWTSGHEPAVADTVRITHEEAFGAARHFGVDTLPGADLRVFDGLDLAGRSVATAVAWRSLQARGAHDEGPLREALTLGADHDLILHVVVAGGRPVWFACRPDRMVQVAPTDDGFLALTVHDTTDLAALVPRGDEVRAVSAFRRGGVVAGHEATWSGAETVATALVSLLPD